MLSVHPMAYEHTSDDLMQKVPPTLPVYRSFALDAARHLSIRRRYPGWLAHPDRWMSWRWDAVRRLRFRSAAHDLYLGALAAQYGVEDLIEFAPPLSTCAGRDASR